MKKIIFVLSVGRTGSSVLTRGLQSINVDLGEKLFDNPQFNPTGTWEDTDIELLEQQLYQSLRIEMFKAGIIGGLPSTEAPSFLQEKAVKLISSKIEGCKTYGFKDPKAWRVLPFWKEVFKKLSVDVTYLISIRNPISVSSSNKALGHDHEGRIRLLWLYGIINMMTETTRENRLVVDYDQFIENPTLQLLRIAKAAGLSESDYTQEKIDEFSREFLDKKLRHSKCSAEEILDTPYLSHLTYNCYLTLQKLASEKPELSSQDADKFFAEAYCKLRKLSPLLQSIRNIEDNLIAISAEFENAMLQMANVDK